MRQATNRILIPELEKLVEMSKAERRVDALTRSQRTAKQLMQLIRATVVDPGQGQSLQGFATAAAEAMAKQVNVRNKREVIRILSQAVGVDVWTADPNLADTIDFFIGENVALIEDISDKSLAQVQNVLETGVRRGSRVEDIQAEIHQRFRVSDSRAELIARDQIGKLNGNLTQMRQQELGLKTYIWRTAGDDRVRESHAAHDGQRYEWADPPAETGHPGDDFQCRCIAEPDLSEFFP